jgi:hypothetical protein
VVYGLSPSELAHLLRDSSVKAGFADRTSIEEFMLESALIERIALAFDLDAVIRFDTTTLGTRFEAEP